MVGASKKGNSKAQLQTIPTRKNVGDSKTTKTKQNKKSVASQKAKLKKETCKKWKEGKATKAEYRQIARNYRDRIRRAKVENDLKLATDTKSNKTIIIILQVCL